MIPPNCCVKKNLEGLRAEEGILRDLLPTMPARVTEASYRAVQMEMIQTEQTRFTVIDRCGGDEDNPGS